MTGPGPNRPGAGAAARAGHRQPLREAALRRYEATLDELVRVGGLSQPTATCRRKIARMLSLRELHAGAARLERWLDELRRAAAGEPSTVIPLRPGPRRSFDEELALFRRLALGRRRPRGA